MSDRAARPFYLDELTRKHESYVYGEADSAVVEIEHAGRLIRLLMPRYRLPVKFLHISTEGDLIFAMGTQLDFEDEDGRIIEGGDGVLAVGVKLADRADTYWTLAWHNFFDTTLEVLARHLGATKNDR
jgi:hypothetical protein